MPPEHDDVPLIQVHDLPVPADDPAPAVRAVKFGFPPPWVRTVPLGMSVQTDGWTFPAPPAEFGQAPPRKRKPEGRRAVPLPALPDAADRPAGDRVRPRPTADTVLVKDRLLYLLQPPIDGLFNGRALQVPFKPFPYQAEGIAFLVPRTGALLADEMGLGKTAQAILSLRLLFHQGQVHRALLIAPKPLIFNWGRELKLWAPDLPFEVFPGDPEMRRATWLRSNCPLKLINYESLTRDADVLADPKVRFDVVLLDEAQRIKNASSNTAEVVRKVRRDRSWALTGTPIENGHDDLVNIFRFVEPTLHLEGLPPRQLAAATRDHILRRTKDDVQTDMPPKLISDVELPLSASQRTAYDRAEKDAVVQLNALGDTVTIQHVFQKVMHLKQICNFDPLTGESVKLDRLRADMEEVAASGRKAIVFSQWVEPLGLMADALQEHRPLQYHGRVPAAQRTPILDRFRDDPDCHVLLMSYGSGSVGLNLQFANYVFLFDRWWNPAVEDQAVNRAHRIGQKHPVTVVRFCAQETIEHRIAAVLDAKRQVFADLLADAEKPARQGLTEEEVFGLFDLKVRPRRAAG